MSYIPLDQMAFRDGPNLDAFGRLRVSESVTLFGTSQEYNYHPLLWDHYTASGGTATYTQANNSTVLSTAGATSGARALRQTKLYFRYTPGKGQLVKMTGTLRKGSVPTSAAKTALGYFDDDNGVGFRDAAAGVAVFIRSNVSGSPVTTAVLQSAWNLDKLDGTGPSGKTVDWTKEQIFMVDLQWLGVGRVRYGLDLDGELVYCHEIDNSNSQTSVYMRTCNLPMRYEAFNDGGAGSNVSVEAICSSVESEAGVDEDDFYVFAYNAYLSPVTLDTTLRPYITRRLRSNFNGLRARGHAHLAGFNLLIGTNSIYWEIRYNATLSIAGVTTTTNVDTNYSMSEFDTYTGTNTGTGGVLVANGFAAPGQGNNTSPLSVQNMGARPLLGWTYAGVADTYTLFARSMTGSATMSAAIALQEQY